MGFFIYCVFHRLLNILIPKMRATTKNTKKIKKIILAIDAAPAAISVNPKTDAMIAITRKISDHLSIIHKLKYNN